MKQILGNYVGIVVQNGDPEKSGKVKVFIPHLSPTIYQNWINKKVNKKFKFLGNNINSVLTAILNPSSNQTSAIINIAEELKKILPWAECATPLAGESSSGRYNNTRQSASISDGNFVSTFTDSVSSNRINNKPGALYEKQDYRLNDAFTDASQNINRPNPLSYQYVPSSYSNKAKGAFCIPSVGSHVWCFFKEGNPNKPVYFASTFSKDDWNGIYDSYESAGFDYPGSFENKIETSHNNNVDTYRNKYVINQKGGSLEIINTDLKERVKITHYSGSFKEFSNSANIELATKNDQKLVLNDSYSTVQGFKNDYTGKSLDEIVMRDKFLKVGKLNSELFDKWKQTYALIHENKQLFEIKRAVMNNIIDTDGNIRVKRSSLFQTRSGSFATHPVTNGSATYYSLANTDTISYSSTSNAATDGPAALNVSTSAATLQSFPPTGRYLAESGDSWGPDGTGFSTSSQDGTWDVEDQKDLLKTIISANLQELTDIEKELGIGGSEVIQIAKHKIETIGQTINDFGSIRYDSIGKMVSNEVLVDDTGVYVNKKASPLIELVHVQDLPGGTSTLNVCNRYNVLVGAGGLSLKSLGQTTISGSVTNIVGQQVNIASDNEINIDAKTINIAAEILTLRNKNNRQVMINSNLGVNSNVIIGGGLHVEGETFIQHITAPKEYQVTEQTTLFGKLLTGMTFTATGNWASANGAAITITLTSDGTADKVQCSPHSHVFANLPLTLTSTNDLTRTAAKVLNSTDRSTATQRLHSKK